MRSSDLIEILQQHPDREVVLASDGEGNSYSPVADHSVGAYCPDSDHSGDFMMEPDQLTDELRAQGYSEDDVALSDYDKCIVLWPTS